MTGHGYGSGLFDQHQDKLASSAIDPEVARERGYVTADTAKGLHRHGFSNAQCEVMRDGAQALVIPLHDVAGNRSGAQMRPDVPRMLKGKPAKYETQSGLKMLLDVPPRVRPHLGDPTRPLFITEGPLKADSMVSAGLDTIALLGVWNWRGTNADGGKTALPDWELVALDGRRIYVVFDSDAMRKQGVHDACARLGAFLRMKKAKVAYVYLPSENGQKIGSDDYLASGHKAADLVALAAPELRKLPSEPATPREPTDNFDDVPAEPGHRVFADVAAFLDRFIAWPMAEQRDAVVLWAAHSHAIDAFDSTPRLDISSAEKQCGKTRLLELLELVCRRARFTVSMTPAYMFRLIEETTPTLLVDEIDSIFGPKADKDKEELRGLLNAGHRRGATVGRMVGEGTAMTPKDFPVFCPVALAGIGRLPDTIHDRSIVVELRRRSPIEHVEPYRARKARGTGLVLGRRLAAWAHRNADALADADPTMPPGISDRPADTWESILAVADAAGRDWPQRARAACIRLNAVRAENDDSVGVNLLTDIRTVFVDDRISSANMASKLAEIEESPWGDWRGKPIDARWLARRLKPYGIRPAKIRIGEMTAQGYKIEDFHDAWSRYLPHPPDMTGTSGTSGTKQVTPTSDVPDVPDVPVPGGGNGQHAVTPYDEAERTADEFLEHEFGPLADVDFDVAYARAGNPGELGPIDPDDPDPWF
jgi:Protein of unknown function (DUF3631)/Domain of unknown function (DUF3854)